MGLSATPPADLTLPDLSAATFVFDLSSGIVVDLFDGVGGSMVAMGLSRPFSPGRSYNKTFWQPAGASGYAAADTPPWTLTTAIYAAEFGAPVVGQRVFLRMTAVSLSGWNGAPVITSTLVVA
jgi:hypothetical protein